MIDSNTVDARQIISALGRAGIRIRALDEAAALHDANPIPAELRLPTADTVNAALTATLDNPAKLAAAVADIEFRHSPTAEQARRFLYVRRDTRMLALVDGAAKEVDKALVKALEPLRVELERAEAELSSRHGLPRPRLTEYDQDGKPVSVATNVTTDRLRDHAGRARDGGAAIAAVNAWEDLGARFKALRGIVQRAVRIGLLDAATAACVRLCNPTAAPPERTELARRADEAARARPRAVEHRTPERVFT